MDDFLNSDQANKYFDIEHKKYASVSKKYFKENAVAKNNEKKDRENHKEWFNKHIPLFEDSKIFNYWKAENQELVDKFREDFKTKYNYLASKNKLPMVD